MADWFTVLASGSSGNASLLEAGGTGLLIDCGLAPRILAQRLAAVGRSWRSVTAVLLTHTHSDHWNRFTLAHLSAHRIPLFVHNQHLSDLSGRTEFDNLLRAGLVHSYTVDAPLAFGPALTARAVYVPHDAQPTCAFRFEHRSPDSSWSLGFASDVGHMTRPLVDLLRGVSVLAVEFNHDVQMQQRSRRPQVLIRRVLGSLGHLSNEQGAEVTEAVAGSSRSLRHLVQLHLSRECNTPDLARDAGRRVLDRVAPGAGLITATQHYPTQPLALEGNPSTVPGGPLLHFPRTSIQLRIPGLDCV